jgi:hypothetical protein
MKNFLWYGFCISFGCFLGALLVIGMLRPDFRINDADLHNLADKTVEYVWYEESSGVALYFFFTDGSFARIEPGLRLQVKKAIPITLRPVEKP